MSYTLKSIEFKISAKGNNYAKTVFASGEEVAIFDKFPGFAQLKVGDVVDGDLTRKEYNGTTSYILNPLVKPSTMPAKASQINKAMDRKEESIKSAQERKEEGIEKSAIIRDATLLTVAYLGNRQEIMSMEEIKSNWKEWRTWLDSQWGQPF